MSNKKPFVGVSIRLTDAIKAIAIQSAAEEGLTLSGYIKRLIVTDTRFSKPILVLSMWHFASSYYIQTLDHCWYIFADTPIRRITSADLTSVTKSNNKQLMTIFLSSCTEVTDDAVLSQYGLERSFIEEPDDEE